MTLWNDTTDCIDADYDQVTKQELSFVDVKAVEMQVKQELVQVIQEVASDDNVGGMGAATGGIDAMDLDVALAREDNALPACMQVTK